MMRSTLKAEFKKLLTIRSTYILGLATLLLFAFISFYVLGYRTNAADLSSLFLAGNLTGLSGTLAIPGAVITLLLMGHEYRYNTIVYTLTASNSRSKVLAAKIISSAGMVFVLATTVTILSIALTALGVAAAGHSLPHQDINFVAYFVKTIFFCEAYAMFALMLATFIKNMIGAIVVLFIVPGSIEGLLGLLLKHNSIYMPFTALAEVIQPPSLGGGSVAPTGYLSPVKGALVFLAYLLVGWTVAWILFLRRDAT